MEYEDTIDVIINHYQIAYDKVFVLQNDNKRDELFITYNIVPDGRVQMNKTISVHRKKDTNTLYTINALNNLILKLNDGVLDKKFPIPWEDYQNSFLTVDGSDLKVSPTNLYQIYVIEDDE